VAEVAAQPGSAVVTVPCQHLHMEVTAERVALVPAANLRISPEAFAAVWAVAEQVASEWAVPLPTEFEWGVLRTCRWLSAQSTVLPDGRVEFQVAPLTGRVEKAMPETIDREYLAAARALQPGSGLKGYRREIARAVVATVEWAWRGEPPPLADPRSG
jgi:hypothetical protein